MNRLPFLHLIVPLAALGIAGAGHANPAPGDDAQFTVSLGAALGHRSMTGQVSDKPKWGPSIGLNYQLGRFFASTERGIGYEFVQHGGFTAFAAAGADPGRKEGDRTDSPRLVGMGKVQGSAVAIAGAAYQALDGLVSLDVAHVASTTRSQGSQTVLGAALAFPIAGNRLGASLSLRATYADRKHAQTYYGVTPAQAARSGNPEFSAKAGWVSCELSLGLNHEIDKQWTASASIGRHERQGAAAKSPLFETRKGTVGAISVSYRF